MEVRNSQSDARERAGGSTALNIVRTLTIFILLAALSFVLGFFVLARLIPGTPKPADTGSASASNAPDGMAERSIPPSSTPLTAGQPAAKSVLIASNLPVQTATAPTTKLMATPGPSLDPINDAAGAGSRPAVQKPHRLETASAKSPSPQSEDGSATTTGTNKPVPAKVAPPEETPPVARPRRHRATPRIKPAVSSDSSDTADTASETTTRRILIPHKAKPRPVDTSEDSGDQSDTAPARPKMRVRDSEAAGSGLFHVHLGAFHSRDAAVSEVERARAKGFAAQIVPVSRNGRTLYRVQAGAFRDRERAESVQQSLQDAHLDARITNQQR